MKRFFLILLFLLVLIGTLVLNTPLSFVLDKAGAQTAGLRWSTAEGTVFKGRLSGASFAGQQIGDIALQTRLRSLLTGKLGYDVVWQGTPGQGSGSLIIGRRGFELTDFNGQVRLDQLRYLASEIRATGARLTLREAFVRFDNGDCADANGSVSSDVLTRFAERFGQDAGVFQGTLACDGPMLQVAGMGDFGLEDEITAALRIGVKEVSSLEAMVRTLDNRIGGALIAYEFEPVAEGYMFKRDFSVLEGLR